MALSIGKESFFWHKLHSLTGIVPVGFYMLQHLMLNSFSLAGPEKYNAVSGFFYSIPEHLLLTLEVVAIWIPLVFHAVYGLFITSRAEQNFFGGSYRSATNRMYTLQRVSGIFIFVFLIYHVITTTIKVKLAGTTDVVNFDAMAQTFTSNGYLILAFYALGVMAASYHLSYGIWNFCIRWGITITRRAQHRIQRFAFLFFLVTTALGWAALYGFLRTVPTINA